MTQPHVLLSFPRLSSTSTTSSRTRWWCWLSHFQLSKVNLHTSPDYSSFECICVDISNSCFSGYCICISPPPGHSVNFFEEFQDLLANVQPCTQHFILSVILIFIWIHSLQQLSRLMISWHRLTQHKYVRWLHLLNTHSPCKDRHPQFHKVYQTITQ